MDEQPLVQHLIELRRRLVRVLIAFFALFIVLFQWSGEIYHWLAQPLLERLPAHAQMIATDVTAPFFVPLKVTLLLAFLLALPYTLYQGWAFVAPGLYRHERRLILPLIVSSVLLFFAGIAFAYAVVFPVVFTFMAAVTPQGVAMMTDIDKYFSFVIGMFIAFGVAFEVPVAVLLLAYRGVVTRSGLQRARPYCIVGAFVIAAIVTPPDVVSQILFALPLCLLYEAGLLATKFLLPGTAEPPR